MYRNTDKATYNIYKKILYDAKYRAVAEAYTRSLDTLQEASQTFSEDQWNAVKNYQNAFFDLHNTMVAIVLHKNKARRA